MLLLQKEDLRRVMELLSVREHHARTLLIHHQWDVERLISVYVDRGKSCMFADAGVTVVDFIDLDPLDSSSKVMCNICMDDIEERDVTRMDCGHCFCNDCKFHTFNWLCTRVTYWNRNMLHKRNIKDCGIPCILF